MVLVYIFLYNSEIKKMSCMMTNCPHGNYLVVTIQYITNHKCVYKNYFYHSIVISSLSVLLGILDNTK